MQIHNLLWFESAKASFTKMWDKYIYKCPDDNWNEIYKMLEKEANMIRQTSSDKIVFTIMLHNKIYIYQYLICIYFKKADFKNKESDDCMYISFKKTLKNNTFYHK